MIRIFLSIILFAVLNLKCNSSSRVIYEVVAQNGGENGFYDSNCVIIKGQKMLNMSEPGDKKRQHCCLDDFSTDVQKLILMCDSMADLGVEKSGEFEVGKLKAEFDIKDKYNYSYKIYEK